MKVPFQFIVVDDDPINNMVSQYMIAHVAPTASIQLFNNPEEALASIRDEYSKQAAFAKTILFLDINMPTMSGWEFLDALSSFPQELVSSFLIFMLSSSIDPKDTQSAESHPLVQGYFSKPLNRETLREFLEGEES